jgi:outer membrane immunogenic protein
LEQDISAAKNLFAASLSLVCLPATEQDASKWAGAYGGLTYAFAEGEHQYAGSGSLDTNGSAFGAIVGYNYVTGPWVLGGELVYSGSGIGEDGSEDDFGFDYLLDLKSRAGYSMNNVLLFGTIGVTATAWKEGPANVFDGGRGYLIGFGADDLATSNLFVGAEYLYRDIDAKWNAAGGEVNGKFGTVTLRAGMKF